MGAIKGVLKEELANSHKMIKDYERALKQFLGGSFVLKKIRGNNYYYLAVRDGSKVKFTYKGKKLSKEDQAALQQSRNMRKKYKQLIKKLNQRVKYLEKVLKGAEDV
ncbi:MAG: hypothetical protein JW938_07540 [Candidatus Omnitrophica bacterium]|nr:hypothetical protein [Candidatus Omnitrophota bacterium]